MSVEFFGSYFYCTVNDCVFVLFDSFGLYGLFMFLGCALWLFGRDSGCVVVLVILTCGLWFVVVAICSLIVNVMFI